MLMTRASLCGRSRSSSTTGRLVETWEIIVACLIFLFFFVLVSPDSLKSARIMLILVAFWGCSLAASWSSICWMAFFAMNSVQWPSLMSSLRWLSRSESPLKCVIEGIENHFVGAARSISEVKGVEFAWSTSQGRAFEISTNL
ncbi:unnamed protein product [Prunus armeniaca]